MLYIVVKLSTEKSRKQYMYTIVMYKIKFFQRISATCKHAHVKVVRISFLVFFFSGIYE